MTQGSLARRPERVIPMTVILQAPERSPGLAAGQREERQGSSSPATPAFRRRFAGESMSISAARAGASATARRCTSRQRSCSHASLPAMCCWFSWLRPGGRPSRSPSLLGLTMAGIGCNMQHDGGHQAYSNYAWINKIMAMSLDFIGGSSYAWHWKHAVFHHTDVNITGHDTDIDLGTIGRLTPHQKRLPFHRWQHLYLWPLYGLMAIKWQLYDDFRDVLTGDGSGHTRPAPQGLGPGHLSRRQGGLPRPGVRGAAADAPRLGGAALLRGDGDRGGDRAERRVPARALRRGGGIPDAERRHGAGRQRLGDPPGGDHRGLRPAQPLRLLDARRAELPDRAPPLPAHLPHPLPGLSSWWSRRARSSGCSTRSSHSRPRRHRTTDLGRGRGYRFAF